MSTRTLKLLPAIVLLSAGPAQAYTAAGDRLFPATILLPQIGPTDELYLTGTSQPVEGGRESNLTVNYSKTITERFGIGVSEAYGWSQQTGAPTIAGWQNAALIFQYEAILDEEHEFLLSIGGEREFGGTGAVNAGADPSGATTPNLYIGKGMGDLDADWVKPVALAAVFGYELGDTAARPDEWQAGLAIEYSLPYLESKVAAAPLPDWARRMTPMIELFMTTPAQRRSGESTSLTVGPGISYAGDGWELSGEALLPATRAAGQGAGFVLQFHVSFDYLFPDNIGRPLLGS